MKMNDLQREIYRETINKILQPELLLDILGIDYKRKGKELVAYCPSPDHEDRNASWSFNHYKNIHNCWSCGFHGSAIGLVMSVLDKSEEEAIDFLLDLFKRQKIDDDILYDMAIKNKSVDDSGDRVQHKITLPKQFKVIQNRSNVFYAYLKNRELKDRVIVKYNIGYCERYNSKKGEMNFSNRVIIPIKFNNKLYTFFARNNDTIQKVDKRWRGLYPKGPQVADILWPYDDIDYNVNYIILVEGPFDALRLISLGYKNVLCYFGNKISEHQADLIKQIKQKMQNMDIIVIPDADGELDIIMRKDSVDFKNSKATKGQLVILTILKNLSGYPFYLVKLPEGEDPGSINKLALEKCINRKRLFKCRKSIIKLSYDVKK